MIEPARLIINEGVLRFDASVNNNVQAKKNNIKGKAFIAWENREENKKLDNIDTDQITPSDFCITTDLEGFEEIWKQGLFRYLLPEFRDRVKHGCNFFVVGKRFGIGSSREMSPAAIKAVAKENNTQIILVCDEGAGEIFRKNAINLGLCVLESPDAVKDAQDDDEFSFDFETRKLFNITQKIEYFPTRLSEVEKNIFSVGGILELGKKELSKSIKDKPEVKFSNKESFNQTVTQQILYAHLVDKNQTISSGNSIKVYADLFPASDGTAPFAIYAFNQITGGNLIFPRRAAIINDHFVFTKKESHKKQMLISKEFAARFNLQAPYFSNPGDGIFHLYLPEKGLIHSGGLYVGADSHSRTYGAYGAIGLGVGSTTLGFGWSTGYIYLNVGKSRKVILQGKKKPGVTGKDVALFLLNYWKNGQAHNQHIEFIDVDLQLPMHYRHTICNLMAEAETQTALFVNDQITEEWFSKRGISNSYPEIYPGKNAKYDYEDVIDLGDIDTFVACPFSPSNIVSVQALSKQKVKVDKAVIGSCTNGSYEDLLEAAKLLFLASKRGFQKFESKVSVSVYPGSQLITELMGQPVAEFDGSSILDIFNRFEVRIQPSWCGLCFGQGCDVLAENQVAITTFNRNWQNRIGNGALQYLSNPAVVISSALLGYIGLIPNLGE